MLLAVKKCEILFPNDELIHANKFYLTKTKKGLKSITYLVVFMALTDCQTYFKIKEPNGMLRFILQEDNVIDVLI